ncbi:hypothetical protein ACSSS7_002276 [Eimeria intestinalis]
MARSRSRSPASVRGGWHRRRGIEGRNGNFRGGPPMGVRGGGPLRGPPPPHGGPRPPPFWSGGPPWDGRAALPRSTDVSEWEEEPRNILDGPMLSFKQFVLRNPDGTSQDVLNEGYKSYLAKYRSHHAERFFEQNHHLDKEPRMKPHISYRNLRLEAPVGLLEHDATTSINSRKSSSSSSCCCNGAGAAAAAAAAAASACCCDCICAGDVSPLLLEDWPRQIRVSLHQQQQQQQQDQQQEILPFGVVSIPTDFLLLPNVSCLEVHKVDPQINKFEILKALEKRGALYVAMTSPNGLSGPRVAHIFFPNQQAADEALQQSPSFPLLHLCVEGGENEKESLREFRLKLHRPPDIGSSVRVAITPPVAATPERIRIDAQKAWELIRTLVSGGLEAGTLRNESSFLLSGKQDEFRLLLLLLEDFCWCCGTSLLLLQQQQQQQQHLFKLVLLLQQGCYGQLDVCATDANHPLEDILDGIDDPCMRLDLMLTYLRHVHCVCYYSGKVYDDPQQLHLNALAGHLRPVIPRHLQHFLEQQQQQQNGLENGSSSSSSSSSSSGVSQQQQQWLQQLDQRLDALVRMAASMQQNLPPPLDENDSPIIQSKWTAFCEEGLGFGGAGGVLLLLDFVSVESSSLTILIGHTSKDSEGRFRCTLCQKLFRAPSFVHLHHRKKHERELDWQGFGVSEGWDFVRYVPHLMKTAYLNDPNKHISIPQQKQRMRDREIPSSRRPPPPPPGVFPPGPPPPLAFGSHPPHLLSVRRQLDWDRPTAPAVMPLAIARPTASYDDL